MKILTRKKFYTYLLLTYLLSLVLLLDTLLIGNFKFSFFKIFELIFSNSYTLDKKLMLYHRLPRVLIAFFAGGAFSLTGYCYQSIFRNSLATPFTTGIISGGTLGAVISISFPSLNFNFLFLTSAQIFSITGSLLVLFLILILTKNKKEGYVNTILLTGITIGIFIGAVVLLIRYLLTPNILVVVDRWMMGGLSISGFKDISGVFPFLFPGLALMFWQTPKLNYLISGKDFAHSRGIDTDFVSKIILIGGTFATASVVSVVGPIAFVGLLIPHIVKSLLGYDARINMPICFMIGGVFLAQCDAIARIIIAPSELPVGIITALLGGIYFIYLINFKKQVR